VSSEVSEEVSPVEAVFVPTSKALEQRPAVMVAVTSGSHGGSITSQGSSRVPQFVGAGSSVGSHSVIPTGNYFNKSARCSHWDIFDRKVVCQKEKCGAQGSHDYCPNHAAATAALPELFCAAKHVCTKNSDGELAYKYKDIRTRGQPGQAKAFPEAPCGV
jgi:hypothetical protein